MKKILLAVLTVLLLIGLCACGSAEEEGWAYGDYMSEETYNEYVSFYNNEWKELAAEALAYADNENVLANEQAAAVIAAVEDREYTLSAIASDSSFVPTFIEAIGSEFTPEQMLDNCRQLAEVLPDAIASLEDIANG